MKKEHLSWLCDDDDVKTMWDSIIGRLEEESTKKQLPIEIACLWITTRGHRCSKTHKIK